MKVKIYTILSLLSLICTSCNNWFDVTAASEIREKDHYSTVTGFQQSLIGCYIDMTNDKLYGTNLSWYATEVMAHQFIQVSQITESSLSYRLQMHNYSHSAAVSTIEDIWAQAYNVIVNANEALKNIDERKDVLDDINYHVIKGELLAIRAYMHFDLLRLYGYGNWANRSSELNSKLTIPYVTELSKDPAPQQTGAETMQLILTDLENAADLLKDYDPITGAHDASYYGKYNEEGFFYYRTLRLNYYAVRALAARAYMWRGSEDDREKALAAAKEVITAVGENGLHISGMYTDCGFLTPETLNASKTSMSDEYLFGLNVSDLGTKITGYIEPNYRESDVKVMYLEPDDAESLYENSATDVRLTTLMSLNASVKNQGYVPLKVYQGNLGKGYKDRVSMIRLPELYYIAAECYATQGTPDLGEAMRLLNVVRAKRGLYTELENLNKDQIMEEIGKEYHKEFLSEGVMFYYYKRTGASTIPFSTDAMEDADYVLPYPEFELQSGRVQ